MSSRFRLARGGRAIKGDESFSLPREAAVPSGRIPTYALAGGRAGEIHKSIRTRNADNPHVPTPTKADAIYMSWGEVTGSNQPGE